MRSIVASIVLLSIFSIFRCGDPAADDQGSVTDDQRDSSGVVLQRADYSKRRAPRHGESADRDLAGRFSTEILAPYDQRAERGTFAGIGGRRIA